MCGISAIFGRPGSRSQLDAMLVSQRHRGPNAEGVHASATGLAELGHNRLSIIDLSDAGRQPMHDSTGRYWIVFNGEIYNYLELRSELLADYSFHTRTDTEVLLAAYLKWGESCLDRLIGMFAFVVWDETDRKVFGARDRFGIKPLYLHEPHGGGLLLASEIKALHAAGVARNPDQVAWATYLTSGMCDHNTRTFWKGIYRLLPGNCFTWTPERGVSVRQWYDLADRALRSGLDTRSDDQVADDLLGLLEETVHLRFRSDVPVGICLSGGLDSSLLLGLVHRVQGKDSTVKTFTFYCGDPRYDELPWVEQMLAETKHPACFCRLTAEEVPALFDRVATHQDEPFGGLPTLGMAKVHERAVQEGVVVLLDGNGLDEGWAGYEYYQRPAQVDAAKAPVQGSKAPATRPDCLRPEFARLAEEMVPALPFKDPLRDLQYRDIGAAKIPRAMRFADRVSMMFSRELREPFLDHRIIELGLRQPVERKVKNGQGKWLVRRLAERILPDGVREAPKRPIQTPQREWLRGPLRSWVDGLIRFELEGPALEWLVPDRVWGEWNRYSGGAGDNSFYVWQWLSLRLLIRAGEVLERSGESQ